MINMNLKYGVYVLMFLSMMFFVQCSKNEDESNREEILSYIAAKNWQMEETETGLFYVVEKEGTGGYPTLLSTVKVHYRGYYLDDEEFDSSYRGGDPISFPLRNVIPGWQEGIPLFQKGGKGKLIVPSKLAYGSNPPAGIRKNAALVFEIVLIDFK